MFLWDRWQFPDGETHLPLRMRKYNIRIAGLDGELRQTYQYPLYQRAVAETPLRRVAVDVGAHIGLFSYWMVRDFSQVVAFEPVEAHRECWRANVPARPDDVLHPYALGAKTGSVRLASPELGSSGGSRITGPGPIPMRTLDSFELPVIDLLKIDCEGFEYEVLAGAKETLARCKPIVCVEQRLRMVTGFGHGPDDAVVALKHLGADLRWTDKKDYILGFAA